MYAKWESDLITLITDYDEEWKLWAELFVRLWPELMLDELAEMADMMLLTFGDDDYRAQKIF